MAAADQECNTGLCLGLGVGDYAAAKKKKKKQEIDRNNKRATATGWWSSLDLSFTLCPKDEDFACDGDDDRNWLFNTGSNDNHNSSSNNGCSRKKLRLTKQQSVLLEDSFKLHTTLNSTQKQALADQLNLKPRQVEVWFQNRRARTKLKQTEVDCGFLKKCCQTLTDENERLKKELQELQTNFQLHSQKATMLTCPSCRRITRPADGQDAAVIIEHVVLNNK